jgi:hypothetical protein
MTFSLLSFLCGFVGGSLLCLAYEEYEDTHTVSAGVLTLLGVLALVLGFSL